MLSGMDRKQQIFFTKYYLLKLSVDQCFHEFKTIYFYNIFNYQLE